MGTKYILLDIGEFWNDGNSPPATLVGVYDDVPSGLRGAVFDANEGEDDPGEQVELDLGTPDSRGDYCIEFEDGTMAYQLLRWEAP